MQDVNLIDLHSHLLPGIDDGSSSLEGSLEMARMMAADGIVIVACTPRIMPGVFNSDGWTIRDRVSRLRQSLDDAGIAIHLVVGADARVAPNLVGGACVFGNRPLPARHALRPDRASAPCATAAPRRDFL